MEYLHTPYNLNKFYISIGTQLVYSLVLLRSEGFLSRIIRSAMMRQYELVIIE